jgi:hypothetical protein
MMNNIRAFLDSLDLADQQSRRMNCPSCHSKNTFSALNDGGSIVYNCFKLNCSLTGAYHTGMTAQEIRLRLAKVAKPDPTDPDRWEIPSDTLMYDVKDKRVVFPIFYKGRMIDAIGRSLADKQPKWLRYTGVADYYVVGNSKTIVLVEDTLSAMIATQLVGGLSAMAILGTSLTDKHMAKLGEYNFIIVALDPDAAHKTLIYKKEIESWTGLDTIALRLDDDIKYKVSSDIEKLRVLTND